MHADGHWTLYNSRQGGRPPRDLLRRALAVAGPGGGRTAIDLGCGAGIETRALLDAGWRVLAVDGEPGTEARVRRTVGGRHPRLAIREQRYEEIDDLPPAALIYSGYALPYQGRDSFDRLWSALRASLLPGGLIAANLFGDRDEWAGRPSTTFLSTSEAQDLFAGLDLAHWQEEDEVGPAFGGPKHWHVFHVIATRP